MLTQKAILLLILLICLTSVLFHQNGEQTESLERRMENTLSQIRGAGEVSIVISMKNEDGHAQGGLFRENGAEMKIPYGAAVVADGADDPVVRMQLIQALCSVLGLPASAVSVSVGGR